MTSLREQIEALPCGFMFSSRIRCLAPEDHPVHRGEWRRIEPNHEYEPFDRRATRRRRDDGIPDRDTLARALVFHDFYDQDAGHLTLRPTQENVDAQKPEADRLLRILAALKKKP